MSLQLPVHKEVRDLFEDLLGRPVSVNLGEPLLNDDLKQALVSLYTDDTRRLGAVVAMDLPLTVYTGAAIGLLPPGGAQDCVDDGVITPIIGENVREVCNVVAALLNRPGAPHVKLYQVFEPGEPPPNDARAVVLALGNRLDLKVDIGGYGTGRLAITLAA